MPMVDKGPILVTGAGGNIGAAVVRQLVAIGAKVIASDRNVDQVESIASATGCRTLAFDLSSEDSVRDALEALDHKSRRSKPDGREHRQMADLRRPALGTADRKPASRDVVLNVSNVAMNSSAGAPGIGHFLSLPNGCSWLIQQP